VARTAAIIWAKHPALTYQEVKQCILDTATPHTDLQGLMVTGGVLNHDAALVRAEELAGVK